MPIVIDWSPAVDPSEVVRRTREALAAGTAVVLPGDCGYLALWKPDVRVELPAPAVLAWGPAEVAALGLSVPRTAHRLMFRAWPAPLVIELPAPVGFPAQNNGLARLRYPEHPLFDLVIPAVAELGPVLVADTGANTATAAIERLGELVGFAVSAGERPVRSPTVVCATTVRETGAGYEITEPGAFRQSEIERLAARIVLFVCTGNTCRSPLAEGLAKKALADRLGCTVDELPARGFWVLSAGVAAYGGAAAAPEAITVAAEFGADLSGHTSRSVNPQLLLAADDVIAMTQSHLHALAARYLGLGRGEPGGSSPGTAPVPRLLCGDEDLDDPIGADEEVYRECARTILRHLERFLPEWVES
jgi:protein-tyrosine phosphatase